MATVVAAEVHFAQRLAGNEKKTRDKAVKRLRKWLQLKAVPTRGDLSDEDLLKIWKGLHYCMWMSDKPLVQEELATTISSLVHCFDGNTSLVFSFIRIFFRTEAREWHGIDRWRMDKFMMLIRRFHHQSLVYLRNKGWDDTHLAQFIDIITTEIIDVDGEWCVPEGLKYHIVDIYLEELSKVGSAQLTASQVLSFLKPFYSQLPALKSQTLVRYIITHLFGKLIDEEVERLRGETTVDDADEDTAPRLEVNLEDLAEKLFEEAKAKSCLARNRPIIYQLVNRLQNVCKGILPDEGTEGVNEHQDPIQSSDISSAVRRLEKLDKHLYEQSGLSERKRRKREKLMGIIAEEHKLEKEIKKKGKSGKEISSENDQSFAIEMEEADIEEVAVPKKARKNGNKKEQDILTVDVNINMASSEDSREQGAPEKKKHKKKKKVTNNESINMLISENTEENVKSKKKRKSIDNVSSTNSSETVPDDPPGEEVDIWIPNKKYKGKFSGFDPTLQQGKFPCQKHHRKTEVKAAPASFAQFEEGLKTPPAFVRKAFTKLRPPQTEPVKKSNKMTHVSNGAHSAVKKRVSFDMKRNTSQDFNDSMNVSAEIPFNPETKPDQSILKSPLTRPRLKGSNSKTKGRRLRASDFF